MKLYIPGPFVVMVGAMATDLLKFAFLYFEFYIPYRKSLNTNVVACCETKHFGLDCTVWNILILQ